MANARRCTECGAPQHEDHCRTAYPESGLDNVELHNVPVWICENHHRELVIPAVTQLHELLAHMIIRKPAFLNGHEIRFLRKRLAMPATAFAKRIALSPVHLSRLENGKRKITKPYDLLIRLVWASLIAERDNTPIPSDLAKLVDDLETAWAIGRHQVRHHSTSSPDREWEPVAA